MRRLLLDVDGVLADFTGSFLRVLREHHQIDRKVDDVTRYDIGRALDLPPKIEYAVYARLRQPRFALDHIEPYPKAISAVAAMREVADVWFVTAPLPGATTWAHDRELWLTSFFGHDAAKQVIHAREKHLIRGDVLVDDKPEHVLEWACFNPGGAALLWDQPWNRDAHAKLTRVDNYGAILRAVLP